MYKLGLKSNRKFGALCVAEEMDEGPTKCRRAEIMKSFETRCLAIVPIRSGFTRQDALKSYEGLCRQIGVPTYGPAEGPLIEIRHFSSLTSYFHWGQGKDDFLIFMYIVAREGRDGLLSSLKRGIQAPEVLSALREGACSTVEEAVDAARAELRNSFIGERVHQQRTWLFLNTPPKQVQPQPCSSSKRVRAGDDETDPEALWVSDSHATSPTSIRYSFLEFYTYAFRVLILMSRGFQDVPFANTIPCSLACQALLTIYQCASDDVQPPISAFVQFVQSEGTQHINFDQWQSLARFVSVMDFPMMTRHREEDGWPLLFDRFAAKLRKGMLWY